MTEQMEAYLDLSVDFGQKLNVDLIIARGISNIENQIRKQEPVNLPSAEAKTYLMSSASARLINSSKNCECSS